MKKTFCLIAALVTAPVAFPVLAHQINFSSDSDEHCNVDLHYHVTVGPDFIEARDEDDRNPLLFAYRAPDQLAVGDEGIILTPDQQRLMKRYQQGLHQSGRKIATISVEAMEIALDGVGIAMAALAGPDNPETQAFMHDSEKMRERLQARAEQNGDVYTLGARGIEADLEETLERELEPRIESLVQQSAGTITWHALKAVFTGGQSIERNAEAAAEAAEEAIEERAEELKTHADALCGLLSDLDQTESALHQAIPQLQQLDLITFDPEE